MSRVLTAAIFFALLSPPVRAYQREQHASTVRLALRGMTPPLDGEAIVASCAQLPDEAAELSAIDVYRRLMRHPFDYARWASRRNGPKETAGRMVAVQQLLHGLTGGTSAGVRAVARRVVEGARENLDKVPRSDAQGRADALCALGFAFHLYGDSFAHSRLKNPARMYDTGVGHLFDGTRPDLPLVSPARLALWRDYLKSAAGLLPAAQASSVERIFEEAQKAAATAREKNGFNELALRELLTQAVTAAGAVQALAPFDRSRKKLGCQALANAQSAAQGIRPAPRCDEAWAIFRDLAIPAFDDYDAAHPSAPSRAPIRARYFPGSPFSKGTKW